MDDDSTAGLSESISGSDSDSAISDDSADGNDDHLAQLLARKAVLVSSDDQGGMPHRSLKQGAGRAPLFWFTSPLLPAEISLGIYRALFSDVEQQETSYISALRSKQLVAQPEDHNPHVFLCMIGGGHFAASIVSLVPKVGKRSGTSNADGHVAVVLAQKTFHRYTTRRKQGGAQSTNDNSKGNAHSAGSSLRRYNEAALTAEVRGLLESWRGMLRGADLLFIRATGTANRRTLFGYEDAPLKSDDSRIRGFPFSTRRATQSELVRCFVELTRAKISRIDEAALTSLSSQPSKPQPPKSPLKPAPLQHTKEEEEALLHTAQLTALIRRSKAPALLSYLTSNKLPADFCFFPRSTHHHSPTPLHLAASLNVPAVIHALLTKTSADPALPNTYGKTSFELAGDRPTRDAFRIARAELGEASRNWDNARVPSGLSRAEVEQREKREKEEEGKEERERRQREMQKIKDEEHIKVRGKEKKGGKQLGSPAVQMGIDKRQQEMGGLSTEARQRLERERRARAAEERIRKMQGNS